MKLAVVRSKIKVSILLKFNKYRANFYQSQKNWPHVTTIFYSATSHKLCILNQKKRINRLKKIPKKKISNALKIILSWILNSQQKNLNSILQRFLRNLLTENQLWMLFQPVWKANTIILPKYVITSSNSNWHESKLSTKTLTKIVKAIITQTHSTQIQALVKWCKCLTKKGLIHFYHEKRLIYFKF